LTTREETFLETFDQHAYAGLAGLSTVLSDEQTAHRSTMIMSFIRASLDSMHAADPVFRRCPAENWLTLAKVLYQAPDNVALVKWIKFMTAWPMARLLRNEPPKCPEGLGELVSGKMGLPLSGGARAHLKNLLLAGARSKRGILVCNGLLQGAKRGCIKASDEFILKSMEDHQKALTTRIEPLGDELREELRKKFRDLWFDGGIRHVGRWRKFQGRFPAPEDPNPGFSASFEAKRSQDGRAGEIACLLRDEIWGVPTGPLGHAGDFPVFLGMHEIRPGKAVSCYFSPTLLPFVERETYESIALRELKKSGNKCEAMVAPVLEPLKCRLITKGSSAPYWAAQPGQRMMWKHLQRFPQFALTGRPLDGSDLEEILMMERNLGLGFDKWVSGDYSAATDGLSQEVNRLALGEFMNSVHATPAQRDIWCAVLGNHTIHYPEDLIKGSGLAASIQQANGQLMGCPLSFPILCAINLVAYWCALEEFVGKKIPLGKLPVKINGDDILFRANDQFYEVWKKWITRCGFTLSVGKNYIHKSVLTVNSELWVFHENKKAKTHRFERLDYLNTGILYGTPTEWTGAVKPARRQELEMKPFSTQLDDLLRMSPDPLWTMHRLWPLWKEDIKKHTRDGQLNLFAPQALGGLGIMRPEGWTTKFTPWQQKVAGALYHLHKKCRVEVKRDFVDARTTEVDLNKAKPPGRLVYSATTKTIYTVEQPPRMGTLVARPILEPLREGEERLENQETRRLMNFQAPRDTFSQVTWRVKELSKTVLDFVRDYGGERISEPEEIRTEWRVVSLKKEEEEPTSPKNNTPEEADVPLRRTDTDFVCDWLPEKEPQAPLRRTDADFVCDWLPEKPNQEEKPERVKGRNRDGTREVWEVRGPGGPQFIRPLDLLVRGAGL
jgi:hypothetical protein